MSGYVIRMVLARAQGGSLGGHLKAALVSLQEGHALACITHVARYRAARRSRWLLPDEVKDAGRLDMAARLLAISAHLDLEGNDAFAGGTLREAARLLE